MLEADLHGSIAGVSIDAQLSVPRGSCTALVGPSGCGKTTILRMIAGLHPVEAGRVCLDGKVWAEGGNTAAVEPQARAIGFVFQDLALFPKMSALENIRFALADLPRDQRDETALKLLEAVGLLDLSSRRPESLSGGERQRLALARALARRPDVLLLDEPFSALDADTAEQMRQLVAATVAERNIACVIVTHDEADGKRLASSTVSVTGAVRRILS